MFPRPRRPPLTLSSRHLRSIDPNHSRSSPLHLPQLPPPFDMLKKQFSDAQSQRLTALGDVQALELTRAAEDLIATAQVEVASAQACCDFAM